MTTDTGRSPDGSGYSAEPEPCSTVSAVPVSIPNADAPTVWHIVLRWEVHDGIGAWVAQCLEHDITAQGGAIHTALTNLGYTMIAEHSFTQRKYGSPFATIPPAPVRLFASFASAIEARSDETQSGSAEGESAAPQEDAQ